MGQSALIKSTCSTAKNDTVAGCIDRNSPLQVYNFLAQLNVLESNPNTCNTDARPNGNMQWRHLVSEDMINCCGLNKMDYRFFEEMFSSTPKEINALDYYQRYNGNEDSNVLAGSANLVTNSKTNSFQLHRASHSGGGKASQLTVPSYLYNYTTSQMMKIVSINTSQDFAHIVNVISSDNLPITIAKGDKLSVLPADLVGGSSCATGQTTMNSNFTTKKTNRLRLRKKWCMDIEMTKPYSDVMQFGTFVDKDGRISEQALPIMKTRAMQEITEAANKWLFLGGAITNPDIVTDGWSGGESLLTSIQGAGNEWDFDPSQGFSLLNDFEQIILQEDAMKRTTEFMLYGSLRFRAAMANRMREDSRGEATSLTFATLDQYGADKNILKKHDVQSFEFLGRKVMFKEWGVLTTTNGIGNGKFPDTGILMSMNGLKNDKGQEVPPVEFFRSKGNGGQWGDMQEWEIDKRIVDGCEKIEGHIIKELIWMVHCPDQHYILNPRSC